ncbi:O-antigen ligase family protein [Ureibacillus terrenus]|uniref:O-antigen ligase family protein n=1 Tax=Ureibacillus terrenus TaxID=118246 RepID=UPI002E22ECC5|nr:O-antigen ligase family protein [Ureibacillus terrenus]
MSALTKYQVKDFLFILLLLSLPFYSFNLPIIINLSIQDIILLINLFYIFINFLNKDLKLGKNQLKLLLLILSFLILNILALKNSPDLANSVIKSLSLLNIFFLVFVTIFSINSIQFFIKVLKIIYYITLVLSINGILQVVVYEIFGLYIGGVPGYPFIFSTYLRATSLFENPNLYSFFLHMGYGISLACLFFYKKFNMLKIKFKYILLNHLLILCAIIASGSKGAFLSLLVTFFFFLLIIIIRNKTWPFFIILISPIISLVLSKINILINMVFADGGEVNPRIIYWKYVIIMFKEKPFIGYGIDSFRKVSGIDYIPHNLYLQTLGEQGILGLSILLLVFFNCIYFMIKIFTKTKDIKTLVIATSLVIGLTQMLIHSISLSSLNNPMLWICISLINIFYFLIRSEIKDYDESNGIPRSSYWRGVKKESF